MISEREMILAQDWRGEDITGWLASEKLNGCRVEWDGSTFWTRGGNAVDAPRWFTKGLPRTRINGEIHAGRGQGFGNQNSAYKIAMTAVVHGGHWFEQPDLIFTALYLPEVSGSWAKRQRATDRAVRGCPFANAIKPVVMSGEATDLRDFMVPLRQRNAEGGMFLNPDGDGVCGRTGELLRIKFEK